MFRLVKQLSSCALLALMLLLSACASNRGAQANATHVQQQAPADAEVAHISQVKTSAQAERVDERPQEPVAAGPETFEPFEDIVVHLYEPAVEVRGWVCLDGGFLEQIACSPGTREHESLIVIRAKPSNIHASLLLAGFESGSPGRWLWDDLKPESEQLELIPPEGDLLDVIVRYERDGEMIEEQVRNWVRDFHDMDRKLPDRPWVFGGSLFKENLPQISWGAAGEHYVADYSGSIIGLVTFGDEVIGFNEVLPDQSDVHAPEWEVDIEAVPPMGTQVTVILRPRQ